MKSFDYTITDEIGIHARPAGILAMLGNAILTPTMEECGKIKKFFYHRSDKTIDEMVLHMP